MTGAMRSGSCRPSVPDARVHVVGRDAKARARRGHQPNSARLAMAGHRWRKLTNQKERSEAGAATDEEQGGADGDRRRSRRTDEGTYAEEGRRDRECSHDRRQAEQRANQIGDEWQAPRAARQMDRSGTRHDAHSQDNHAATPRAPSAGRDLYDRRLIHCGQARPADRATGDVAKDRGDNRAREGDDAAGDETETQPRRGIAAVRPARATRSPGRNTRCRPIHDAWSKRRQAVLEPLRISGRRRTP